MSARRATAVAAASVVALLVTACAHPAGHDALDGRLVPRGGVALAGPAQGTGDRTIGTYRVAAGETVGIAIDCEGRGFVRLEGGAQVQRGRVGCSGGTGGLGPWITSSAERGSVRVIARRGTRWRVAFYRAPVPLDDSSAPEETS